MSIKETLLQRKFVDSSVALAEVMAEPEDSGVVKEFELNKIWLDFKTWVYDNYKEQ